jgi:hypothetical protein
MAHMDDMRIDPMPRQDLQLPPPVGFVPRAEYDAQAAELTRLRAAVDDVVCGRGMFGLNPADDLKWAVDHLSAALPAYEEARK